VMHNSLGQRARLSLATFLFSVCALIYASAHAVENGCYNPAEWDKVKANASAMITLPLGGPNPIHYSYSGADVHVINQEALWQLVFFKDGSWIIGQQESRVQPKTNEKTEFICIRGSGNNPTITGQLPP
jgi:hypothetical protein